MAQTITEDISNFDQIIGTHQPSTIWTGLGALCQRLSGEVTSIPASGTAGYSRGHRLRLTSATLGQSIEWMNIGSSTSCLFVPVGPVASSGAWAPTLGGFLICTTGSSTQAYVERTARTLDRAFMNYISTDDHDTITKVYATTGLVNAVLSADPLSAHYIQYMLLSQGGIPNYDIVAAGIGTTAHASPYAITVSGVKAGDIAIVCPGTVNTAPRTCDCVVCTTDTVTLTLSGAPTDGDKWNYVVFRQRGSFKPSHYIAYAGTHTSTADVGAPFTNDITVTGALATDIPMVQWDNSDDTDTITLVAIAADTITVTMSANPDVVHAHGYMVLRAY